MGGLDVTDRPRSRGEPAPTASIETCLGVWDVGNGDWSLRELFDEFSRIALLSVNPLSLNDHLLARENLPALDASAPPSIRPLSS